MPVKIAVQLARPVFNVGTTGLPGRILNTGSLLTDPAKVQGRVLGNLGLNGIQLSDATKAELTARAIEQNTKAVETGEIYKDLPTVQYDPENKDPQALVFRAWHPQMRVGRYTMSQLAPFAMPAWHGTSNAGTDIFSGVSTMSGPLTEIRWLDPLGNAVFRARSLFEFCGKLGMPYYCAHDGDFISRMQSIESAEEQNAFLLENVFQPLQQSTGVGLGWWTNQFFVDPRYSQGAAGAPTIAPFALALRQAMTSIKTGTVLDGQGFVFWGGREGYDDIAITMLKTVFQNSGEFFRKCVDFAKEVGFFDKKGRYFWREPKGEEPTTHQYDHDAETTMLHLIEDKVLRYFKLNIEGNHADLAHHTPMHEFMMSLIRGMLYGIDANTGRPFCGWDKDCYPDFKAGLDIGEAIWLNVLFNGLRKSVKVVNFDAKSQRNENDQPRDMAYGVIGGMDHIARGIVISSRNPLHQLAANRYAEWNGENGQFLRNRRTTLQAGGELALKLEKEGLLVPPGSSREAYANKLFAESMFGEFDRKLAADFRAQVAAARRN